jgi:hypothetical protein
MRSERPIHHQVYFMTVDNDRWRDIRKNRMRPLKQEGDGFAGVVDSKCVMELLTPNPISQRCFREVLVPGSGEKRTRMYKSFVPITTSGGTSSTLFNTGSCHTPANGPPVPLVDGKLPPRSKPSSNDFHPGIAVRLQGDWLTGRTRPSVDLRDYIMIKQTFAKTRKDEIDEREAKARRDDPYVYQRTSHIDAEVPEGSSLVFEFGANDQGDGPGQKAEAEVGEIGLWDIAQAQAQNSKQGRSLVIVITPEPAMDDPADGRPKPRPE